MFGAAQLRSAIGAGDVAYLANLCHDCRMCYDACMFTPPHEFALNIPAVMTRARAETYVAYAKPAVFSALFRQPGRAAGLAVAAAVLLIAAAVALWVGTATLRPQLGPGAFYRLVPYAAMVAVALGLALYGFISIVLSARAFARDVGDGVPFASAAALRTALHDALSLVYLKGGGSGCYDQRRSSGRRRFFHALVFWGFMADVAATISAAVLQDVLGRLPPYPLWSAPVVLGTGGGLALAAGAAGLIAVKRSSDPRPTSPRMIALDYAFLGLLELTAITGLALLVFRSTGAMGALLVVHLGAVAGLFITTPYGKFVHAVYRFIALVKNAHEQSRRAA